MMEMSGPPGTPTPTHLHLREEETIYVVEGALDVISGGTRLTLQPGDTALFKRNQPHKLIVSGEKMARYVVVCTPAGFDEFVAASSDVQAGPVKPTPPTPEEIQRLLQAASQFGISVLPD